MTIARKLFAALLALLIAAPVFAQAQRTYSQPELDQMLAPIALYPDALLSQILMAATYPAEVSEAARWSRAYPGLQGDDAVRAVQNEDWDPSVKSLLAFPQVLARMDENRDWTRSLGEAFLAQQPQMMDQVQLLRRRAQAAGNLRSDEQIRVEQQGPVIVVQAASPQYVYVPYYDPLVVYGPWWWPAYQPVYWSPWPRPYAIRVSLGFFFGNFDWHRRHVQVAHPSAYYYRPRFAVNKTAPHRWQHEPRRREAFAEKRAVQAPRQIQAQPQFQQQERRIATAPARPERRFEQRQQPPQPQANAFSAASAQPAVQARPLIRVQPAAQARPQPRARMPEAISPQQPRAERHDPRREPRNERGNKGKDRS